MRTIGRFIWITRRLNYERGEKYNLSVKRSFCDVDHNEIDYDHSMKNDFENSGSDNILGENLNESENEIYCEILVRVFDSGYSCYDHNNGGVWLSFLLEGVLKYWYKEGVGDLDLRLASFCRYMLRHVFQEHVETERLFFDKKAFFNWA